MVGGKISNRWSWWWWWFIYNDDNQMMMVMMVMMMNTMMKIDMKIHQERLEVLAFVLFWSPFYRFSSFSPLSPSRCICVSRLDHGQEEEDGDLHDDDSLHLFMCANFGDHYHHYHKIIVIIITDNLSGCTRIWESCDF